MTFFNQNAAEVVSWRNKSPLEVLRQRIDAVIVASIGVFRG